MATKKLSLMEFAQSTLKPECVVCALPERDEIDNAYRSGVTRRPILSWLWETREYAGQTGYDENNKPTGLSSSALDKHLTGGHHLQKREG